MFKLEFTTQFKKDLKYIEFDKTKKILLDEILLELKLTGTVDKKYKPHKLEGNYVDCIECHIKGDFLLIWRLNDDTIVLVRLGSHSKLF